MTVGELKRMLLPTMDTDKVVIEVAQVGLGPTPAVDIKTVNIGFDWDMHRVILRPIKDLSIKGDNS